MHTGRTLSDVIEEATHHNRSRKRAPVALITGVTGQDGSYLADFLLTCGYEVYGTIRPSTRPLPSFTQVAVDKGLKLQYLDMTDSGSIEEIVRKVRPYEIYNLAAQSHVGLSFKMPEYTTNVNALGALRILEAVVKNGLLNRTRVYQASTSELYGNSQWSVQSEKTPFKPVSPYGTSKLFAHQSVDNYREAYRMFACCGILFNHESPRRRDEFVTRKITKTLAQIKLGREAPLILGNIDAKRDWGFAQDYVIAQWLMLQADHPRDYVIASGVQHSVREFVDMVANRLGMDLKWDGHGFQTKATYNGKTIVSCSMADLRPIDVSALVGDYSRAWEDLGWYPKTKVDELVALMVDHDLRNT